MRSAKVGDCERCCSCFRVWSLQIFNVIDVLLGTALLVGGIFMRLKIGGSFFSNIHTAWLAMSTLVLGFLLILISFLSCCAVMNSGCRWLIHPSGYLALLVALVAVSLACAGLAEHKHVTDYLNHDAEQAGLSSKDVSLIKNWFNVMIYALFGLFCIEVTRFVMGRRYRETALRIDGEFDALLAEDDRKWNTKITENKAARGSKYDDLRAHYKAKYAPRNDIESSTSSSTPSTATTGTSSLYSKGTPARF